RHFNDWEIDRVAQFLHVINEFNGFAARLDRVSWIHSEDGRFTVNKLYKKEMETQQGLRLARWKYVWTSQAPTKIKYFVWLVDKREGLSNSGGRLKDRKRKQFGQILTAKASKHKERNQRIFQKLTRTPARLSKQVVQQVQYA
ncbi:hypothetical protein H5410_039517, partial [Solanum commersonii]